MEAEINTSLEYTPTWIVALVCFIIVLVSLFAERGLHYLGKFLTHRKQDKLFGALQKLKEELMLLGFISLLLTVFQGLISRICIPTHLASFMLPCKRDTGSSNGSEHYSHRVVRKQRQLLSEDTNSGHSCLNEGKYPLLSLEALHQLHIFIFVLAVVHVIFCVTTVFLGGARIRQWKPWEDTISQSKRDPTRDGSTHAQKHFLEDRAIGRYWRRAAIVSWMISFFKQFYGSVSKSDYIALRQGFIKKHCPNYPDFNFHNYMMRTLEVDFKKVVGISWYLWLFVVVFLLLNLAGWHTYFWLSFLPLILLLFVGAKLEDIITRLAMEVEDRIKRDDHHDQAQQVTDTSRKEKEKEHEELKVKPSDDHFWFGRPAIVLNLIHFILFQNSFEIAFFFWILTTYGFNSCIMEKVGYVVTRLIMGVIVQVLCSYSTFPLYAIVTLMGSTTKKGMIDTDVEEFIKSWRYTNITKSRSSNASQIQMQRMNKEVTQIAQISDLAMIAIEETTTSITEALPSEAQEPFPLS